MKRLTLATMLTVCVLAAGCTMEARHDYYVEGINFVLHNQDQLQLAAAEYSDSAKAKADVDLKQLDAALMLEIADLTRKTYKDETERQAAVLGVMQKYKASVVNVSADMDILRTRDSEVAKIIDANKETLTGILAVEARSWANLQARETLIQKATVTEVLGILKGGAK